MLEYFYKSRRTLVHFRRGPLGPFLDGFAASLKKQGFSSHHACHILGKCCQFNDFLIERGITFGPKIQTAIERSSRPILRTFARRAATSAIASSAWRIGISSNI